MNTNTSKKKQVAIVTGASSGMGLGITQALLRHGYHVVANSRNISKSRDLKDSSDLILVDGDISKIESAVKVVDAAIKHFNHIDLLVNNVGIYMPKPFINYTPADFVLMIGTNVAGYFFITQRVVAQMRKQKSGHIVGISTVLVDQPLAGLTTSMHANDDHEILKKRQPFPRLVQISEIVDALLYLQSARMVNGENIRIDGG